MLRSRDEAVMNPSVAANVVLISRRVEKADVEIVVRPELGQVDGVEMLLGIVVIVAVARQTAEETRSYMLSQRLIGSMRKRRLIAQVSGQSRHERRIDDVPGFPVVLGFLIKNLEQSCARFADSERSELGVDVRHGNIVVLARGLDLFQNGLDDVPRSRN